MANDSSFLFSGIRFNRKKFGADIARFQKKDNDTDSAKIWSVVGDGSAKTREAVEEKTAFTKKRKRKGNSSENVEGFNVFRNSASAALSSGEVQADQESIELSKKKNKKEQNRQFERDAIFRKQHNIHVSGYNVPSPLQSFDELKSRKGRFRILMNCLKIQVSFVFVAQPEGAWIQRTNAYSKADYSSTFRWS